MSAPVTYEKLTARQIRMYWGSFWLIILSESMIFVTVFAVRFLMAFGNVSPDANRLVGGLITLVFVASVVPARSAVRAIRSGHNDTAARSLLTTAFMGLLAFAGVIADLVTVHLDPSSRYGESYFLATGYHALHIFIGLLVLFALASSARRARFNVNNYWSVEAGAVFWYFVVILYIVLYGILFWA